MINNRMALFTQSDGRFSYPFTASVSCNGVTRTVTLMENLDAHRFSTCSFLNEQARKTIEELRDMASELLGMVDHLEARKLDNP